MIHTKNCIFALLVAGILTISFAQDPNGNATGSIRKTTAPIPTETNTDSVHSRKPDASGSPTYLSIREITFIGNQVTSEKLLNHYLKLTPGMPYDSHVVAEAQTALRESGLFRTATIIPRPAPGGKKLLVVVSERPYLSVTDIGGELYGTRYGQIPSDWFFERWFDQWFKIRLGITHTNFRGMNEQLGVHFSFWDSRSLAVSWYKPFLGTRYFTKMGMSVANYPDLYQPWRYFAFRPYLLCGSQLSTKSRVYAGVEGTVGRDYWSGPAACRQGTASADAADSGKQVCRESPRNILKRENFYEQLEVFAGWIRDTRDNKWDPRKGLYTSLRLSTNTLYPREPEFGYHQASGDTRFFHPGFTDGHRCAYRLGTTLRIGTSAAYDALRAGGESTIRGFATGQFGAYDTMNNRITSSLEYRIPLFKTPEVDFGKLSGLHTGLHDFYYRVDLAPFVDAGYLWKLLEKPTEQHDGGIGAGLGIRVLAPTLKRSVSFDLAWNIHDWHGLVPVGWKPSWALYLDAPF